MKTNTPKLSDVCRERLEKLATHLESGTLGHERFDYRVINTVTIGRAYDAQGCGTIGCALGELPFVFPDQWQFGQFSDFEYFEPHLIGDEESEGETFTDAAKFFGIDWPLCDYLFVPETQHPEDRAKVSPPMSATRHEVAAHIRAFIASREAE